MSDLASRRDFLAYSAAAIVGVTLGESGRRWLARADTRADAWRPRGVETWAATVCRECPAGCGANVRLVDDVPVKIEGNPLCPIARGRLCARGQAAIESYFDPDRFVGPAHRVTRGGAPRWEPLPWTDAVALAVDRLRRAAGTPDGIVVVAAEDRGPMADAWTRIWRAAGARVAWTPLPTAARLRPALARLTGADGDPVFDVEHVSYVLSFGAPLADDWLSGVWTQRSFGRFRRRPGASRGRLVQIDGRRSPTVRKADEWLAVPPDKQAALAYGIASVLFRENRIDRDRLDPFAGNLANFEHQVITYYTSDNVSTETGVPVVTILRLARELASAQRPLVIVDAAADAALVDAVFALNVLIGAVDRPGGLFAKPDDPAQPREDAVATLRAIDEGRMRPSVLVFADSSAFRALGGPNHPESLSERVPFVINLSPYVDEAAMIADLILPTDVAMESWQATVPPTAVPVDVVAASRPAVTRRLDTRDIGTLLKSIAAGMGGAVNDACTWASSEDLVRTELKRLARLRRGTPYVTTYETDWMRQLESGGWWARAADSDEAFVERVLAAGGWVDPFVDSTQLTGALRTGHGLTFPLPVALPSVQTVARTANTPGDHTKPADPRFPVKLVAFHPSMANLAGNPNLPALFELLGQPDSLPWAIWVEIGTEISDRLGVTARARVRIRSAHDVVEAVAVRVGGMPANMAAVSFVPGGQTNGRWARLLGKDPRGLWGNDAASGPCAVEISRI
jgi:anaerobic selenocysteine-containing dehydrogenase